MTAEKSRNAGKEGSRLKQLEEGEEEATMSAIETLRLSSIKGKFFWGFSSGSRA